MQYFLNGGRNERAILKYDTVIDLYGRLDVRRILFIVYALVEEDWHRHWQQAGPLFSLPGMELKALTLFDTDQKMIKELLNWADFIYFPGGSQGSLLKRMRDLGTKPLLDEVIKDGQLKLLGGGSAGAMVMGSQCILGHKDVKSVSSGLGYLSNTIVDSHFTERNRLKRLQPLINQGIAGRGLGIDEDTAILLDENGTLQVVYGPGTVTVCSANKKEEIYDQHSEVIS